MASDDGIPIDKTIVKIIMKDQAGNTVDIFNGLTDDKGKFNHKWKIEKNLMGSCIIELEVKAEGYDTTTLKTSFRITENV